MHEYGQSLFKKILPIDKKSSMIEQKYKYARSSYNAKAESYGFNEATAPRLRRGVIPIHFCTSRVKTAAKI